MENLHYLLNPLLIGESWRSTQWKIVRTSAQPLSCCFWSMFQLTSWVDKYLKVKRLPATGLRFLDSPSLLELAFTTSWLLFDAVLRLNGKFLSFLPSYFQLGTWCGEKNKAISHSRKQNPQLGFNRKPQDNAGETVFLQAPGPTENRWVLPHTPHLSFCFCFFS